MAHKALETGDLHDLHYAASAQRRAQRDEHLDDQGMSEACGIIPQPELDLGV